MTFEQAVRTLKENDGKGYIRRRVWAYGSEVTGTEGGNLIYKHSGEVFSAHTCEVLATDWQYIKEKEKKTWKGEVVTDHEGDIIFRRGKEQFPPNTKITITAEWEQ